MARRRHGGHRRRHHHHHHHHHNRHHHHRSHFHHGHVGVGHHHFGRAGGGIRHYRFKARYRRRRAHHSGSGVAATGAGAGAGTAQCQGNPSCFISLAVFFFVPGLIMTIVGSQSHFDSSVFLVIGGVLLGLSVLLFITFFLMCFMCEAIPGSDTQTVIVTTGGVTTSTTAVGQVVPSADDVEMGPMQAEGQYPAVPTAAVAQPVVGIPQAYPQYPSHPSSTQGPVYPSAPDFNTVQPSYPAAAPAAVTVSQGWVQTNTESTDGAPPSYDSVVES